MGKKKRNFYFPPKQTPTPIHVSDDAKAELMKLAEQYADEKIKERSAEDLSNYVAFTLEALSRLGWTGKTRLNRFLSMLTLVSEEATSADDSTAYAREIKERMTEKGVTAFLEEPKNDDHPQQEEAESMEK